MATRLNTFIMMAFGLILHDLTWHHS